MGNSFLVPFLEKLGISEPHKGNWTVTCEQEKVDVMLVRNNPKSIVLIENKSEGAQDQPNQLYRYFYNSMCNRVHRSAKEAVSYISSNPSEFKIVYLTHNAFKVPEQQSITCPAEKSYDEIRKDATDLNAMNGLLVQWTFEKEILDWLKKCQVVADSEGALRVTDFVKQYLEYWEKRILWYSNLSMEESKKLETLLLNTKENFISGLKIQIEINGLKQKIQALIAAEATKEFSQLSSLRLDKGNWHDIDINSEYEGFILYSNKFTYPWECPMIYLINNELYLVYFPKKSNEKDRNDLIKDFVNNNIRSLVELGFNIEDLDDQTKLINNKYKIYANINLAIIASKVLKSPEDSMSKANKQERIFSYYKNESYIFKAYSNEISLLSKNDVINEILSIQFAS